MTELPHWAIWLGVFLPILTAFIASIITWTAAKANEKRARREELMRQVRWAAELAISGDPRRAQLGVDQLDALERSPLFTEADKVFIDAAMTSVVRPVAAEIESGEAADQAVCIVNAPLESLQPPDVPLGAEGPAEEEANDVRSDDN